MIAGFVCIWIAGLLLLITWHVHCYIKFKSMLKHYSKIADHNSFSYELMLLCKEEIGISTNVTLMLNSQIASPMISRLMKPVIYLPEHVNENISLKAILTHELIHLKRKDLWTKMLMLTVSIIHWFNPLIALLRKDIDNWCELSCDETLVRNMNYNERKLYGNAILDMIEQIAQQQTTFCSSFRGNRKFIERRLIMLLKQTNLNRGIKAFSALLLVGVLTHWNSFCCLCRRKKHNKCNRKHYSKSSFYFTN